MEIFYFVVIIMQCLEKSKMSEYDLFTFQGQ